MGSARIVKSLYAMHIIIFMKHQIYKNLSLENPRNPLQYLFLYSGDLKSYDKNLHTFKITIYFLKIDFYPSKIQINFH